MIRFNLISGKCIDNVMSQSTFRVNSLNPESVRSMKSYCAIIENTKPVIHFVKMFNFRVIKTNLLLNIIND